jgi:hypothetical protein
MRWLSIVGLLVIVGGVGWIYPPGGVLVGGCVLLLIDWVSDVTEKDK